jgi:hypothetical protein
MQLMSGYYGQHPSSCDKDSDMYRLPTLLLLNLVHALCQATTRTSKKVAAIMLLNHSDSTFYLQLALRVVNSFTPQHHVLRILDTALLSRTVPHVMPLVQYNTTHNHSAAQQCE